MSPRPRHITASGWIRCLLLAAACLTAQAWTASLSAGAWPRDNGKAFAATSVWRSLSGGRVMTSVYTDIGLGDGRALTFELDLSGGRIDRAFLFYRLNPGGVAKPGRLSLGLGLGTLAGAPAVSPRISFGRGFRVMGSPGWAEATLTAEYDSATARRAAKLDLTLGLSPTDRVKSYVQLFAYKANDTELYLRAESSVTVRLSGSTWLDVGLSTGLAGDRDRRVKVGLWMSF